MARSKHMDERLTLLSPAERRKELQRIYDRARHLPVVIIQLVSCKAVRLLTRLDYIASSKHLHFAVIHGGHCQGKEKKKKKNVAKGMHQLTTKFWSG